MNTYRRALIDYWIEIGKLEKVHDGRRWRYIFKREDGEDCLLSTSWAEFFKMFNLYNEIAFHGKTLRPEYLPWQPFDPWRNPFFRADIQRMAAITAEVLACLNNPVEVDNDR